MLSTSFSSGDRVYNPLINLQPTHLARLSDCRLQELQSCLDFDNVPALSLPGNSTIKDVQANLRLSTQLQDGLLVLQPEEPRLTGPKVARLLERADKVNVYPGRQRLGSQTEWLPQVGSR